MNVLNLQQQTESPSMYESAQNFGIDRIVREKISGTAYWQITERDDSGVLIKISINDHPYVQQRDGQLIFDHGFVTMTNTWSNSGLLRTVKTPFASWQERYGVDRQGLPVNIDGMQIKRDSKGRVTHISGHEQDWAYRFHQQHIVGIDGPFGHRRILCDNTGRPVQIQQAHYAKHIVYNEQQRRKDLPTLPENYCFDDDGRLRAVLGENGYPMRIYLWDGYHCLARLDGKPGAPLSYVYSLDYTGTPVRLIARDLWIDVPRDAYGENLLDHSGHPGLFGGAIYKGYVFLKSRIVDSRSASFNAPDPLHGGTDDPRRQTGYRGKLFVETPKAGAYAVCQYDPIAYLDPTGEIAWYYVISTLTWAFPNNILSWIGLEATANFWGTFFTGSWRDWADAENWTSNRLNIGAVQRQSFFAPNPGGAFTTQHIVWARHDYIDKKRFVAVFDPGGNYQPQLYASMLRVVPSNGNPFLLNGQQVIGGIYQSAGQMWVRAGGTAVEAAPGQRVPIFPDGGLHFPFQENILGPQNATLTELTATASVGVGTLDNNTSLSAPSAGLTLNQGDLVLLTDGAAAVDIIPVVTTIPDGTQQTVRLASAPVFAATSGITLRALAALAWTENLQNNGMPATNYLDASTTANTYQVNDALQLDDGTLQFDAQISAFETQVTLDAQLDGSPTTPLTLFSLTVDTTSTFNADITGPTQLDFGTGPVPSGGEFIFVSDGVLSLAIIVGDGTGSARSVDRDLSALNGPTIDWQRASRGADLGVQSAAIVAGQLTYAPAALNLFPATGDHIGVEFGPAGAVIRQLRTITNLDHHALVLNTSAPLPAATGFSVDRYPVGNQFNNLDLSQTVILALSQGNVANAISLQAYQFGGPAVVGNRLMEPNMELAGDTATGLIRAPGAGPLTPNQPVTIRPTGTTTNDEGLVIQRVERDVFLNFDFNSTNANLELVQMALTGFAYDGLVSGVDRVVVSPVVTIAAASVQTDMPSFFPGECVELVDSGTGDVLGQYTITSVPEGTVLELANGPALPAVGTAVTVQRIAVMSSGNGATRIGINGQSVFPNAGGSSHVLRADVWSRDAVTSGTYLGVIDDNQTLPFVVRDPYITSAVAVAGANQLDLSGASIAPADIGVSDHILLSWIDNTGAAFTQTFSVTNIAGSLVSLNPVTTGTVSNISDANTYNFSPITVRDDNRIDIAGSAYQPGAFAVGDLVRLRWLDATGANQEQTFVITLIDDTDFNLTRAAGTPLNITDTDTNVTLAQINIRLTRIPIGDGYDVTVSGINSVDLAPSTLNGIAVDSPVFAVDDIVFLFWQNIAGEVRAQEFQITAVAGTVLSLDQNNPSPGLDITLTDTDVTLMRIPNLAVQFTTTPATAGPIDLFDIAPANTQFFAQFTRETDETVLMPDPGNLISPSPNAVMIVPLAATGTAQSGTLSSGTGKVPEDPENWENDRRQMLVEHELRHTEQYLWYGPIFLTMIPFWPVELLLELTTDIEQPEFGPFQQATLVVPDSSSDATDALKITFEGGGNGGFSVGDLVQVNQGVNNIDTRLVDPADGESGFRIARQSELRAGTIHIRTNNLPPWAEIVGGIGTTWFKTLSIGGLTQLAASLTHGTFFQIVGRFFYMIYRAIQMACCDDRQDGEVQGSRTQVKLADASKRGTLENIDRLLVQEPQNFGNAVFSGIDTVVRSRNGAITDDGVITLSAPLPWDDGSQVQIGPYQSRTPGQLLDWKKYYPATVQTDNPYVIQIHPIGSDTLNLQTFDRLRCIAQSEHFGMFNANRTVTAVNGDMVELHERVPGSGTAETELTVRVAKIGTADPYDFVDSYGTEEIFGSGWLRWATDPFGQLYWETRPQVGTFWDVFARIGKYLLGTKGWSNPIILTSRYFWEAMTKQLHNVSLEQDASEQSGELYTPIGRIRGEANVNNRTVTMTVGDIARFWYFGYEFSNQQNSLPPVAVIGRDRTDPDFRMDDPGNHLLRDQIVYPQQAAETPGAGGAVNSGAQAGALATAPGLDMADAFWQKRANNPNEVSQTAPDRRMVPNDFGLVPQSRQLQLSSAVYLAFTRPTPAGTTHRATMDDNIDGGNIGRDAQNNNEQRLFYNITVQDVTVNINNVAVADGDTINLLRTQSADITVSDEGTKQYTVRVMEPDNGNVVRATFSPNNTVSAQDPFSTGAGPFAEPFQICRWHDFDEANNQYRSGGLAQHSMHLPADIFIPVRKLTLNVVEAPPVLSTLPATLDFSMYPAAGTPLPTLQPGATLFFPVASNVMTANQTLSYVTPPAPDVTVLPNRSLQDVTGTASTQVQAFLGDGELFSLSMGIDEVPEEQSNINVVFTVGDGALSANITMAIAVDGHFLARDTGPLAASGYQIAVGGSATLACVELDGATTVTPDAATVTFTQRDGSAVPQVDSGGTMVDELTFTAAGNQLTINVDPATNAGLDNGFRRLLIIDAGGAQRARRTIQII